MGIAGKVFGVAPGAGWVGALGGNGGAFEYGLQVAFLVERQVDGLTHFGFVERRMLAVDRDKCRHERVSFFDFNRGVLTGGGDVQRFG
ncbi:hypothetical protein D3C80_1678810 [compost metagenome]